MGRRKGDGGIGGYLLDLLMERGRGRPVGPYAGKWGLFAYVNVTGDLYLRKRFSKGSRKNKDIFLMAGPLNEGGGRERPGN